MEWHWYRCSNPEVHHIHFWRVMVTSPYRQPGCNRVDVFVDRYDRVPSIKSGERQRRSPSNPSLEVMIRGPNTPKRWNTVVHSRPKEKSQSCRFSEQQVMRACTSKTAPRSPACSCWWISRLTGSCLACRRWIVCKRRTGSQGKS